MKLAEKDSDGHLHKSASGETFFDVNQLELALINERLNTNIPPKPVLGLAVKGLPKKTLEQQKKNLIVFLKGKNKSCDEKSLAKELSAIFRGEKLLPIR